MRRILFIALTVVLAAALVGGGTMALFFDRAESEQISVQAGTLLIEAGTGIVYGVEQTTGDLYEIDVSTGAKYRIYDTPHLSPNINSPNGLAYDNQNRRLYFAVYDSEQWENDSVLWFYCFDDDTHHLAGQDAAEATVDGIVAGACFGRGHFWYVRNETDDLYKVRFDPVTGYVDQVTLAYPGFTGGEKTFRFGDVAMESFGNILYGSSLQSGTPPDVTPPEFFKIDLTTGDYTAILVGGDSSRLQLAFGADGELYGHSAGTKKWYRIETGDGAADELAWSPGERIFTDLASNFQSNWNPGDCDMARFYVRNEGQKDCFVRVKLHAEWEGDLPVDVVSIEPCDDTWQPNDPDDSHLYYQGWLEPGEEVLLCVIVCLLGEETGNEYQGKTYELWPEFQAIQTTHGASLEEWGWTP